MTDQSDYFIIDGWEIDRQLLTSVKRYGCSLVVEREGCEPMVFDFDSVETANYKYDQLVEWLFK